MLMSNVKYENELSNDKCQITKVKCQMINVNCELSNVKYETCPYIKCGMLK